MPADSSIYSMIRPPQQAPGPLDQYAQGMQLKALIGQGELHDIQKRGLLRDEQTGEQLRSLFGRNPNPTDADVMAIDPLKAGPAYLKQRREGVKADADLQKVDRENFIALADASRKSLATVTPDTWAQYRDGVIQAAGMFKTPEIRALALKAAQAMPAQFDPNYVRNSLVSSEKLFTPELVERTDGQRKWMEDKNPFTNPAILTGRPTQMQMTPDAQANAITVPDASGNYVPNRPVIQAKTQIAAAGRPNVTTNILPPQKTFENEDKLRNDYTANPMVKSSSEMQNAFNMIESAYKRPSPANDLAMATKYMKILDPTSVVRESEFALAVNATGLLDKVQNYAASIIEGKKLNPTQRKDFYESAKAINDAFQAERQKVDEQYSEMATGYGLNPKNVIPSLRSKKPDAGKPTPQARKTIGGKNYIQVDGNWFEE